MINLEVSSSLIMEDLNSIVISEDISQDMTSTYEDIKGKIDLVRRSYVSILKIVTIIWVYDRICYIYKSAIIILKIGKIAPGAVIEEKLVFYKYDIQYIRFLMPNLGVPP